MRWFTRLRAWWILLSQDVCPKHLEHIHYQLEHNGYELPRYCCDACFAEQKEQVRLRRKYKAQRALERLRWAKSVMQKGGSHE